MNKIFALFLTINILTISCDGSDNYKIEHKEWHISPDRSPMSSILYPFIEWKDAMEIKIGLTEKNAEFDFQYYHHPINAIVFTKSPKNENYEIALKLSKNKKEVTDISFLKLDLKNE